MILPGGAYSEGAHIQALGSPHNGSDTTDDVLCLCPTCHVMFDGGAIVLTTTSPSCATARNPGRCAHTHSTRSTWPASPSTATAGGAKSVGDAPFREVRHHPHGQRPRIPSRSGRGA
ncbi:HNH endonuclease [Streptomyces sp. NBC_01455]|uniref:HNH endonuclease n=1 Tax=Streptomyces sp. NBC_01455 TaxID=2903874 RepID=UPI002E2F1473|nr:HNH endonuclease [Streptomyces sp. NBC_01455]